MDRPAAVAILAMLAGLLSALCALPACAIPFSLAAPPVVRSVLAVNFPLCLLDISSRGITSINATDLAPFVSATCAGGQVITAISLANNSLSWLPSAVFTGFSGVYVVTLARNQFNSSDASIGNLFGGTGYSGCVFCPLNVLAFDQSVDLSFNPLGPSVPAAFRKSMYNKAVGLILWGCGITDIQPYAFANATLNALDLSLNDLSSGLHPGSFSGRITASTSYTVIDFDLTLHNCRLRSNSLVPGLFDTGDYTSTTTLLYMSNLVAPMDGSGQYKYWPVAPNVEWDPMQRALTKERFHPTGQAWTFNPPTPAQFEASWGNLFVDFPAGLFHRSGPPGPQFQPPWYRIEIGDVVSLDPAFLGDVTLTGTNGAAVVFSLAPNSIAHAFLPVGALSCPMHSIARALAWTAANASNSFELLSISGYDQPTTAECGPYTTCVGCRIVCTYLLFPVEPAFVEPAFSQWLGALPSRRKVAFTPPVLDMWNPRLNRSDWIDPNFFCDVEAGTLVLPALPYDPSGTADVSFASFPFPPPSGMFACMRDFQLLSYLDWSMASSFTAEMLTGLNPQATTDISLELNLEALYGSNGPVPAGLFDLLPASVTVVAPTCINSVSPLCQRISSHCPYIVNGGCTYNELTGRSDPASCLLCPPGTANPHFGGGLRTEACALCPLGSASGSSGVAVCPACPGGSFADAEGGFACQLCAAGTYGEVPFGAISRDNCTACPGNAPASPVGSASIVQCSTGVVCPSGLWTAPGATGVCTSECPIGSSCAGGVRTLCASGSYQSQPGMGSCTPCGAGYVGSFPGSSRAADCMACPPSTYSSDPISTHCTPCDVGLASTGVAHANPHDCAPVPSCLTAQSLAFAPSVDPALRYCAMMTTPFPLSSLLPGGLQHMQSYLQRCALIVLAANQTVTEVGGGLLPEEEAAFAELILSNMYAAYQPLRQQSSLRIAAFGSDALLDAHSAGAGGVSIDKSEGIDTSGSLSSSSITALIVSFLLIAFLPWALYRVLPSRVVIFLDQFNIAHKLHVGESVTKIPTQFGAVVSWSFLCVAMLIAILLGTQSNTLTTVKLLPPSASNLAGSAVASWELTVRVYAGQSRSEMAVWCAPDGGGLRARQLGFSEFFKLKTTMEDATDERGSSCSIAASCASCGLTNAALCSLVFPYSAQLIEWEVWVSSAEPGSWIRRYGVLTQLPGRLLDIESRLSFTAMESFYSDERSAAFSHSSAREEDKRRSGFELNFVSYDMITPQNLSTYTPASTVTFSVSIVKSDVLLQTALTDKQTPLQIVTLIASACVSLFSIFAITFRLVEAYVLKRCGLSPGPIGAKDVATGRRASILAAPANGTTAASSDAPSDSIEMQISPNPAVSAANQSQQWNSGPSDADELGRL